ncbi:MAG: hypothetical protein KHX03_05575 [Clostridium sp.]|nr:hypothetical protein [Clostridium sp.]
MISINFNPNVLITQRNIDYANTYINQTIQRLSTGAKINIAKDDPSGYYIAKNINSQIRGMYVTRQNIVSGINFLTTASNSLTAMNKILERLNDLSLQVSNGTMDKTTKSLAQREANTLLNELFRIKNESEFNNINVFGADKAPVQNNYAGVNSAVSTPPPNLKTLAQLEF